MMIERAIYQVLTAGREHVNDEPKFLEDFFKDTEQGPGLDDEEIDQIRTFWDKVEAIDPDGTIQKGVSIIHQFPRGDGVRFPCWAIVLLNEQEDTQFLGDEAGIIGDDGEDVLSSIWAKSYAIFTYAPHPLICLYYHELAKFFLTRGRPYLKGAAGGYNLSTKFSGGDMAPDPRYGPANMFVRRFQIDVTREERVLLDPQIRGGRTRGMFGPPEGPADIEGVSSSIDTYGVGEE